MTASRKILVIGGGIIGSAIAWRLSREGAAVTVLERGRLGREASWAAAGMIAPQAEAQGAGPFFDLCIRARDAMASAMPTLQAESGVDPEYDHAGILYVAFNDAERTELEERGRWQLKAGGAVEELSPEAARRMEPAISREVVFALHLPLDRRTDNRKLTHAYANAAIAKGAKIIEGAEVESVTVDGGVATGVRLRDGRRLPADIIVNAAGAWAGNVRGLESDGVETYPVRGQMVCFEGRPGVLGPSVFSLRGYVVPRRDGRIIAGSTMEEAGYDKSVTLAGLEKILRGANDMVPSLGAMSFREVWAGLRPATRDFLPVLGPSPSIGNVFYAVGHFRSGILLSAITGEIVADMVSGRKSALELAPFSPARFNLAAKVKVLGLVRDILFRSRIDAVAQALGVEVAFASDLAQASARATELKPAMAFADLSDANFPAGEIVRAMRGAVKGVRLIGFASHVDLKPLASAREAGFETTLSRSEFTARLPELLKA